MSTQPLENAIALKWEWTLQASPEALWPFVSDTNRMNVLAGMSPVRYTDVPRPEGGNRRVGHSKMMGMEVSWDEHPFRWVYPESFQVFRTFHSGPLNAYVSKVVLTPAGKGTRLTHTLRIVPQNLLFKPFVLAEGVQLEKRWGRAYKIIDDHLSHGAPHPFGAPSRQTMPEAVQAIAERLKTTGQDPEMVTRLVEHLLGAHEIEVQHLRPFMLADRWNVSRTNLLELFMVAAANGLLESRWSHLCPQCRGPKASADHPDRLAAEAACQSCGITFKQAADETVELAFRPTPAVRKVTGTTYCVGGPGATPHVLYQDELPAGERVELNLPLEPGLYRLRTARPKSDVVLNYLGTDSGGTREATVQLTPVGLQGPTGALSGETLRLVLQNDGEATSVALECVAWGTEIATASHVRATPSYQAFMKASEARA